MQWLCLTSSATQFPSPAMPLSWGWQSESSRKKASKVRPIIHTTLGFFLAQVSLSTEIHTQFVWWSFWPSCWGALQPEITGGISVLTRCHLLLLWEEPAWWTQRSYSRCRAVGTALQWTFPNTLGALSLCMSERCFESKFFLELLVSLNPCAPNLKRPDFPRVGGKVTFQLLESSDDLYSLNKNRFAVPVLL